MAKKQVVRFEILVEGDDEFPAADFQYTVQVALTRRYPQFQIVAIMTEHDQPAEDFAKEKDDGPVEEVATKPEPVPEVSGGVGSPSGASEGSPERAPVDPEKDSPIGHDG